MEVRSISTGGVRSVMPIYQDAGHVVSRNLIGDLVVDQALPERPEVAVALHLVRADLESAHPWDEDSSIPGVEEIALWAQSAAEAFSSRSGFNDELGVIDDQALGWYAHNVPQAVAWHDETVCVVPVSAGSGVFEFSYEPEEADERRTRGLEASFGMPAAAFLDCRGYFGSGSTVADIRRRLIRGGRAVLKAGTFGAGVIVGKVLRLLGDQPVTVSEDRTWESRLSALTSKFSVYARETFDLRTTSLTGDSCIVIVHGTASCAIPIVDAARMWSRLALPRARRSIASSVESHDLEDRRDRSRRAGRGARCGACLPRRG